jgi:hypothetical protein
MKTIILMLGLTVMSDALAQETLTPRNSASSRLRFEYLLAEIQNFERRYTIRLRGAEHPEVFRHGVILTSVLAYGGPSDDIGFAQFALEQYGASGDDVEVLKMAREAAAAASAGSAEQAASVDHCARLLEGAFRDGVALAQYIVEQNERPTREAAIRNRSFLDRLSPPVRGNVLRRVDERVADVASSNLDHLTMATVDPDLYVTMVTGYCRGKQHALERLRAEPPAPQRQSGISVDRSR